MQIVQSVPRITPAEVTNVAHIARQQVVPRESEEFSLQIERVFRDRNTGDEYSICIASYRRQKEAPDYTGYPSWKSVKSLMGRNFYGPEDLEDDNVNFSFSPKDLQRITNVPWTKEILEGPCPFHKGKTVKESHLLTLVEIRNEESRTYRFGWVLAVMDPPLWIQLTFLKMYGFRRADSMNNGPCIKILARRPEM